MDAHELAHQGLTQANAGQARLNANQSEVNDTFDRAIGKLMEAHEQMVSAFEQTSDRLLAIEQRVADLEAERS